MTEIHDDRLMCQAESRDDCSDDTHWRTPPAVADGTDARLTDDERKALADVVFPAHRIVPQLESVVGVVQNILSARLAQCARTILDCPHGSRHYYAADATCQRCEMPSWVEALIQTALANGDQS